MNVVLILGMHRSGTSCLAKCLSNMGLSFVLDQLGPTEYSNHLEYGEIVNLNDQILGSWNQPILKRNIIMKKYFEWKVGRFLRSAHKASSFVGIKDPRLLLTFSYWIKHVDNFKIIGIYRRPMEVVHSFSIRNKGYAYATHDEGLELWRISNMKLLELQRLHNFPIFSFNLSKTDFGKCLHSICQALELPFSRQAFEETFVEKNRHHSIEEIPEGLRKIYDELERQVWQF